MSSDQSYKKNVNVERRTWDKESFAKRAAERKARGGEEKDDSYAQQERVKVRNLEVVTAGVGLMIISAPYVVLSILLFDGSCGSQGLLLLLHPCRN